MIKICWKDHQRNARFDFFTLVTMGLPFFFNSAVWKLVTNISGTLNVPIFRLVEFYIEDKSSWFIQKVTSYQMTWHHIPEDSNLHHHQQKFPDTKLYQDFGCYHTHVCLLTRLYNPVYVYVVCVYVPLVHH